MEDTLIRNVLKALACQNPEEKKEGVNEAFENFSNNAIAKRVMGNWTSFDMQRKIYFGGHDHETGNVYLPGGSDLGIIPHLESEFYEKIRTLEQCIGKSFLTGQKLQDIPLHYANWAAQVFDHMILNAKKEPRAQHNTASIYPLNGHSLGRLEMNAIVLDNAYKEHVR